MSMSVILVKEGVVTTPNGVKKDFSKTFDLVQLGTSLSEKIVQKENIEDQLLEYENSVHHMFEDEITRIFKNEEDKIKFMLDDDRSVPYEEKVITAEEQLQDHMKEIRNFIHEAHFEGFDVGFSLI